MSLLDGLRHRLYVLWRGERYAREVEREMRFHLELEARARTDRELGAELDSRRTFGNTTYYREEVRRVTPLDWLDRIRQDASYAWRGLRRSPALAVTVVLTLGFGLGVNAAMYSFLDQLFVRPPDGVVAPEGVRRLYLDSPRSAGAFDGTRVFHSFNYPTFAAIRRRIAEPEQIAAFTPSGGTLITGSGIADSARVSYVTPEFFHVLRLRPALGRFFAPEEGSIEAPVPLAVIGHGLWQRVFGADLGVLGRTIELNHARYTVIGIAPTNFSGIDINLADVWVPLSCLPIPVQRGRPWYEQTGNYLRLVARLDAPSDEARLVAAGTAATRYDLDTPGRDTALSVLTGPILEARGPARLSSETSLGTRLGGVAFIVLLIACANVTNVLLLRAASRRRELAMRRALGVSRGRLYSQLATESVLLGLLSAGVALLFALWGGAALRRLLMPTNHWASPAIGTRIVIATTLTAIVIGIVAGLFPAIGAMRSDLSAALKVGARGTYRRARSQSVLLVVQAALSLVLLVGAGLFVRSLVNVLSIDLGYIRSGMVITSLYIRDEHRLKTITQQLPAIADRIRARPGVAAVALSNSVPMGGYAFRQVFLPGRDSVARIAGEPPSSLIVSPGFFEASGVRLVAGRDFSADDAIGSARVAIVDEVIASAFWPGKSAIGKCITMDKSTNGCTTVIGVVRRVHRLQVIEPTAAQYYLPLAQFPTSPPTSIVVRVDAGQTQATLSALRNELSSIMPDHSEFSVRTLDAALDRQLRPWRMGAILFSSLGLLALVVAAIGIYGVVAYAMSQRTHEMGVRIALGARAADIVRLVLGDGLRLVVIGLVIGALTALAVGRLVASLLFGIAPNDPAVMIGAIAIMLIIAAVASLIPGLRSARVDAAVTLRAD